MKKSTYYILIIVLAFLTSSLLSVIVSKINNNSDFLILIVVIATIALPLGVFIYSNKPIEKPIINNKIKRFNFKFPSKKFWAREFFIFITTLLLLTSVSIYKNNKKIEKYNEKYALENKVEIDYVENFYSYMKGKFTGEGSKMNINTFKKKLLNNELITYKLFVGAPITSMPFYQIYYKYLEYYRGNDILTYEQFEKKLQKWDFDKFKEQKQLTIKIENIQQKIYELGSISEGITSIILIIVYPFRIFIFMLLWSINVYRKKQ